MKISSISRKVSFGYDKQLHEELKERLKQHPDRPWAQTLSRLSSQCDTLENRMRKEEKKSDKFPSQFGDYKDIFLNLKEILTGYVSLTFDDFDFAEREYKSYYDEFIKRGSQEDAWQKDVCDCIAAYAGVEKYNPDAVNLDSSNLDDVADALNDEDSDDKLRPALSSIVSKKTIIQQYKPTENSPKGFCDVAGMESVKRDLREGILEYISNPEQAKTDYIEYGKTIPKGILMYGPPGCGKTYITQALSAESGLPLYMLNLSKAGSHYINLTSKNIQTAFNEAAEVAKRSGKPCLLFLDEIDTLGFDRNSRTDNEDMKQVGTLLQAIDSAKDSNVIIIGATNKYSLIDPAIKRRFDQQILVDLPDEQARKSLIIKNLSSVSKGAKLLESEDDINEIVKLLNGYSNSSICIISKRAGLNALRRGRADISVEDYKKAEKECGQEKPRRAEFIPASEMGRKIGF